MESPARNVSGEDGFSPLHNSFAKWHIKEVEVGKLLRVLGQSRGLSCTWRTEESNQKSSTGMNKQTCPVLAALPSPSAAVLVAPQGYLQLMGISSPPQMKSAEAAEQSRFEKSHSAAKKLFKKSILLPNILEFWAHVKIPVPLRESLVNEMLELLF